MSCVILPLTSWQWLIMSTFGTNEPLKTWPKLLAQNTSMRNHLLIFFVINVSWKSTSVQKLFFAGLLTEFLRPSAKIFHPTKAPVMVASNFNLLTVR